MAFPARQAAQIGLGALARRLGQPLRHRHAEPIWGRLTMDSGRCFPGDRTSIALPEPPAKSTRLFTLTDEETFAPGVLDGVSVPGNPSVRSPRR